MLRISVWAVILLQVAALVRSCELAKVQRIVHELSRFTYPLFDVRQHEAHSTPKDVVDQIRVCIQGACFSTAT